jgi:UDP:flavonoid glycosyltransferase YjiC (YdhE family)
LRPGFRLHDATVPIRSVRDGQFGRSRRRPGRVAPHLWDDLAMRVLGACSLGGAGHLQPLRAPLDAARRLGADTLIAGPPAIASMVEQAGIGFVACGEPPEELVAPIRERLPVASAAEASVLGNRELFGRLATTGMLPGMDRLVSEWRPDLIVREPCEYASAMIGHREGVAVVQVAIGLADVEWSAIGVAAPALEAHRSGLTDECRSAPYASRLPASLDPSPFPDTRRFREVSSPVAPLPDWWEGSGRPLVYASLGTVLGHMSAAASVYRVVLAAVADLDVRVLLTVGRRFDPAELGAVPPNVHVEPWVDQADALAEADLVVCHGGSGTTFGALAAGLPVVIVPLFADQFANAARVAAAGAGVSLDRSAADGTRHPPDRTDVDPLATAIEDVRGDPSFRRAARDVADEMAAFPTIDRLLEDLSIG